MRSRIKVDGGRPIFAHFDGQLLPSNGRHDGIRIEHAFDNPVDARWIPAIKAGVEKFIQQRIEMGKPVCNTTFVMTRVISHPIDTDEYAVTRNVALSLQRQFDTEAVQFDKEHQ